ncbi:MAG: ATP-binding protein [Caldimonas sp.]
MSANLDPTSSLQLEIAQLKARLEESEDTLAAIRRGDVDALIVGDDIYTLDSAHAATNKLRKDVLAQMEDAVVAFDNDEHVIFMNAAAERQYRVTASATLGRPRSSLYQESWPNPKDELTAQQVLAQSGTYRAHTIHSRHDGSTLHVEATVSRLRDALGAQLGDLSVVRDISERINAEQTLAAATHALARRERQFATLVENSPDVIARVDRDLRHLYVSPAVTRFTAPAPAAFTGKTNRELGMPTDLCDRWEKAFNEVLDTGQIGRILFTITTPSGEDRVLESRLMPEFADDGSVDSVLSIASDITEQEMMNSARSLAEEALRDADRRKDEFLATLAHELRNPLAPISNALQIMQLTREPAANENARNVIERQVRQMVHLVDDLLDVSRISQGKVVLRRERVDLAGVVQTAIETSRPLIDANHHHLTMHLPRPGAMTVDADVTRLTQIVANLLNNAAKYTPPGGRIEVTAERQDDRAVISVRDSGIGIPPDMLPRVFDMFAQVDRTLERSQGGLGIGLALVKRLIEMHGGDVEAHSDGPGRGCRFVVRMPLLEGTEERASVPEEVAPERPVEGFRVLVVDDNVDSAESLSRVLEMLGYETRTAHDGLEAVVVAAEYRPRAALLDIGLPGISGHDAARRIRAQADGRPILLIALSGWGQDEDRRKSKEAGFDHHFVKPVDLGALMELLGEQRRT